MKIIITERQYNKVIVLRRINEIMHEALLMIRDDGAFYGDVNFCYHYPTFEGFMEDMVEEIIRNYEYFNNFDISDFIYDEVGFENFINILIDVHGDEIREFYNSKTEDC
jgi:hypothetical protein